MKKGIIAFSILLLAASCSNKTVEAIAQIEAKLPTAELTEGKAIYEKKCHRCHKLKVIDNYSAEAWNNILPKMAKKARLDDISTTKVKAYITWELAN